GGPRASARQEPAVRPAARRRLPPAVRRGQLRLRLQPQADPPLSDRRPHAALRRDSPRARPGRDVRARRPESRRQSAAPARQGGRQLPHLRRALRRPRGDRRAGQRRLRGASHGRHRTSLRYPALSQSAAPPRPRRRGPAPDQRHRATAGRGPVDLDGARRGAAMTADPVRVLPLGGAQKLRISLAGLPATLSSFHPEFMAYASAHLAPLRAVESQLPSVEATLTWHECSPPADRAAAYPELAAMDRIDRDVYRSPTEIAWFRIDELPSLHLRFAWDGRCLRVHGDFFLYLSRNPYRDWLTRGLRRRYLDRLRRRRFTTLLYYLLYYPCFWVLERTRDLHPIHAAGVELDGQVVVLAGPSGVGKSTLVTGLAGSGDARLLSDTFL